MKIDIYLSIHIISKHDCHFYEHLNIQFVCPPPCSVCRTTIVKSVNYTILSIRIEWHIILLFFLGFHVVNSLTPCLLEEKIAPVKPGRMLQGISFIKFMMSFQCSFFTVGTNIKLVSLKNHSLGIWRRTFYHLDM